MTLTEILEKKTEALKVPEVAKLLNVTPQHIYKMAAKGAIPYFRVGGAIRFDPQTFADWLSRTSAGCASKQPARRSGMRQREQRSA